MKKFYFLLFLPFFLLSPCHGSLQSVDDENQDMARNLLTHLTTGKLTLEFVRKSVPDAQTWEEVLEGIYASQVTEEAPCDDALHDFVASWLASSRNAFDSPMEVKAQDISHPLQQKIFRFTKAREALQCIVKAQWDAWEEGLGSQTSSAFVQAFLAAYPDALPQKFDEFSSAIGVAPVKKWSTSLIPHALIRATFSQSLEGIESARYLVKEECGFDDDEAPTPDLKVKGMEDVHALQDLRSLFLHRAPKFFSKKADPWPLLETLGKLLPGLTQLETLQLPVLFAHEEAQARALLGSCAHLKQVILCRFNQDDGAHLDAPLLDPETLFSAVPEGVETFLREERTFDTGLVSIVPAYGGIYPYTASGKSPIRVAPYVENLNPWRVHVILMDMVKKELGAV